MLYGSAIIEESSLDKLIELKQQTLGFWRNKASSIQSASGKLASLQ